MSTNPDDRLDRIEAALENQIEVNASLRTSVETLRGAVDSQRAEISDLKLTAEALLQVAQLHQRDIEILATEFRQHRSDGHGNPQS